MNLAHLATKVLSILYLERAMMMILSLSFGKWDGDLLQLRFWLMKHLTQDSFECKGRWITLCWSLPVERVLIKLSISYAHTCTHAHRQALEKVKHD